MPSRAQVEESEDKEKEKELTKDQQKTPTTILEQEIHEAREELERPKTGLFISGLSAGLDIGFSVLLLAIVVTQAEGVLSDPLLELLKANAYTVGFILVIFGRSALFTEHTTLAVLPVLGHNASLRQLARLWGIVYFSNLAGGVLFAYLLVQIGPALGIIEPSVFGALARQLTDHSGWVILLSGILAGWLMGLASWLVTAGRDTISEIAFVWVVTGSIGLAKLHHCIVGSVEVLAGVFASQGVTFGDYLFFLFYATLGNIVGGVFFVAVIKYGHATRVRRGMRHTAFGDNFRGRRENQPW